MIYLHHLPLSRLFDQPKTRLLPSDRQVIRDYRHQVLSDFCAHQGLPAPTYGRNARNKPICTNSALAFNHTHCQTHYALVYGLECVDLGVDVEAITRQANFDALAKRYFCQVEYDWWASDPVPTRWCQIWTAKEAALKACGIGIYFKLNKVNTRHRHPDWQTQGTWSGVTYIDGVGAFLYRHLICDGHVICVAVPKDQYARQIVLHSQ